MVMTKVVMVSRSEESLHTLQLWICCLITTLLSAGLHTIPKLCKYLQIGQPDLFRYKTCFVITEY